MNIVLVSLLVAGIGALPLTFRKRFFGAIILGVISFLVEWLILYVSTPSTAWPAYGIPGFFVGFNWAVAAMINSNADDDRSSNDASSHWIWVFPAAYLLILMVIGISGWSLFKASDYAAMLGQVEERDWTKDVQPKDPRHMRMVSEENAMYIAKKAVANAGAIGSQFSLSEEHLTLQRVKGELVYVVPFDFAGFSQWTSSSGSPGFIIIDAEDPERAPKLVQLPEGRRMKYMPGAFFSDYLERHMRNHGFTDDALVSPRFELDEEGTPWWIVSTYKPTIAWSGEQITGVAVVSPVTGEIHRYGLGEVPEWIDRVFPSNFIHDRIAWRGEPSTGWLNSFWGTLNLTEPGDTLLIYGSNDRAEWVTGVTSKSAKDDSLLGLMYTDSRTGKSVYYKTNGGSTDTALLAAANKHPQVQFRHLHATTPQIYNVYGVMAAVAPLLNDNHAYQGMAIVSVANPQDVAVGQSQSEALRAYQTLIFRSGQQIALNKEHVGKTLTGVADRVRQDVNGNGNTYLFHIAGVPRIFTASSGENVKVVLTQPGDTVTVTYIASGEDVVPVQSFDNLSLPLDKTQQQQEVVSAASAKRDADTARATAGDLVKRIQTIPPGELQKLEEALHK